MSNETPSESGDHQESGTGSLGVVNELGFQLLFPAIVLVFVGLYVENTYGRLEIGSLVYPYSVIGVLLFLTVGVSIREIYTHLSEQSTDESPEETTPAASISEILEYNQKPIRVAGAAVVYPLLIEGIGFFPASAMTLAGLMFALGVQSWRRIAVTTILLLAGVYLMFVEFLGLRVPQGMFGV